MQCSYLNVPCVISLNYQLQCIKEIQKSSEMLLLLLQCIRETAEPNRNETIANTYVLRAHARARTEYVMGVSFAVGVFSADS